MIGKVTFELVDVNARSHQKEGSNEIEVYVDDVTCRLTPSAWWFRLHIEVKTA